MKGHDDFYKYFENLIRNYMASTGIKRNVDSKEAVEWYKSRKDYVKSLYLKMIDLSQESEEKEISEIGAIDPYNTLSKYSETIKPYSIFGDVYETKNIQRATKANLTAVSNKSGLVFAHSTDLTENNNIRKAIITSAWGEPDIVVSAYGSIEDKDRKAKIYGIKELRERILYFKNAEIVSRTIGEIVKYDYEELDNGIYVVSLATDKSVKSRITPEMLNGISYYLPFHSDETNNNTLRKHL